MYTDLEHAYTRVLHTKCLTGTYMYVHDYILTLLALQDSEAPKGTEVDISLDTVRFYHLL